MNQETNTLYVTNQEDGTVSVINDATCNAVVRTGCGARVAHIVVGDFPNGIAVDERTDTVYVANAGSNTVSIIDGATCNARDHAGCGQVPTTVAVGAFPFRLALDDRTDTIYVANVGSNTVSVIDADHLQRRRRSGCADDATRLPRRQRAVRHRRERPHQHRVRVQQWRRHPVGDERRDLRRPVDCRLW